MGVIHLLVLPSPTFAPWRVAGVPMSVMENADARENRDLSRAKICVQLRINTMKSRVGKRETEKCWWGRKKVISKL